MLNRHRYYQPWRRVKRPGLSRLSRPTAKGHLGGAPALNFGHTKKIFLAVFFTAAAIWFIYFFFASGNFLIRTININGLASIPRTEFNDIVKNYLSSRHLIFFHNNNNLLFSTDGLIAAINKKYVVDKIQIDRNLPWILNINVEEKQARLLLRRVSKVEIAQAAAAPINAPSVAGENTETPTPAYTLVTSYYYLDVNGIVVAAKSDIDEAELQSLPVVEIAASSQTPVKPGDTVLDQELVGYMFTVYDDLNKSRSNIKVAYLIYDSRANDELKFVTSEGWQGFLSQKLSLDSQLRKLELALDEKIKDKRGAGLQYVDLRVKDRVYFK
ncbi:MAG: hypothetical protein Q8L21_01120 [Candidatus Komeilibacteria bacterium]|nr:hypothetical protein [Candidatus Komeilibacteria bacterium]